MIGTIFRLKRECMGNPAGTIGYVFNKYDDFDVVGEWGVQVIFPNGEYCGFSVGEQALCFENFGFSPRHAGYDFVHINRVLEDHRAGFWFPEAKRGR